MRTVLSATAAVLAAPLALPVVLLALPFWSLAFATRALARWLEPRALDWSELIEYHPEVGWKPRPNLRTHALDFNRDPFRLSTDGDGWRGTGTIDAADVVVFGDSFAFGHAIDDEHFFAEVASGIRVKAIGAPGYNMVQSLLWLERYASRLRGKLVVWLAYPGNDLEDNIRPNMQRYRAPFVRASADGDGWEIVTSHVRPEPWTFPARTPNFGTFIEICRPTAISRRALAACEFLVRRANDVALRAGAELVVASIPDLAKLQRDALARAAAAAGAGGADFDVELPDRELARICARIGARFVALRDHLGPADYHAADVHWNARGHRRVAALLGALARDGSAGIAPVRARAAAKATAAR